MLVQCIISNIKLDFMIKFTLIITVYIKKALENQGLKFSFIMLKKKREKTTRTWYLWAI